MKIIKMKKNLLFLFLFMILSLDTDVLASANTQETDSVTLPIIMYHSLHTKASGEYTITPAAFEKDLQYLKDNGHTTVTVSDLIRFVYHQEPLPNKPIVLTFDDGFYNNLIYTLPLLKQYDMKAVISIIGVDTEKWSNEGYEDLRYGHLTWSQISELLTSGHVEIGNHTYNLHVIQNGRKGSLRQSGESLESYRETLQSDLALLQTKLKEHSDTVPVCFTYPFGFVSPESTEILKTSGFKAAFTTPGGPNVIVAGQPDCLFHLKRFNRSIDISVEKILK